MTWVQLLTDEPELLALVQRCAPEGTPVRILGVEGARAATPAAAVVVASRSSIPFLVRSVEELEDHGLASRTVALAPFSREMATALVRLTCSHVVWLDDADRALVSILGRMVQSDLRFLISGALLTRCGDDDLLRRTVREAFVAQECPTTVAELAARAHCTPSTLRAHWRRSELPDSPQALVDWAVLAALAELHGEGSKISAVSRLIGLHETTLYRAARRRVGASPSMVDRAALLGAVDRWLPGGDDLTYARTMHVSAMAPIPLSRQSVFVNMATTSHGESQAARRPPHVLIIEDEVGAASLILAVVRRHGHGCSATIVGDGLQAMRYLRGVPPYDDRETYPTPDLVILDLALPGISGFQVLTWMDNNQKLVHSPVVVFSGSSDPESARRAFLLGARAFLPKSADPVVLAEVVRDALARWAPERRDGTTG